VNDLTHLKSDFPVLDSGVHFLDSGASSQKPIPVLEAMDRFARTSYANVHRGAYKLSVAATDAYEAARHRVAAFINASTPDEVVFTRGATTALNTVAFGWGLENLGEGDRILATEMEHHANLVPWQMVAKRTGATLDHVAITDEGRLDMADYEAKIGPDVKIVAVTGMSNVLGTIPTSAPSESSPTNTAPEWWSMPRNWCPTTASTCRPSAPTSSPSRPTRCWAPPGSVSSGGRWTPSRRPSRSKAAAR
jgi:selenocysteine lyase/cysteine desulfurase